MKTDALPRNDAEVFSLLFDEARRAKGFEHKGSVAVGGNLCQERLLNRTRNRFLDLRVAMRLRQDGWPDNITNPAGQIIRVFQAALDGAWLQLQLAAAKASPVGFRHVDEIGPFEDVGLLPRKHHCPLLQLV